MSERVCRTCGKALTTQRTYCSVPCVRFPKPTTTPEDHPRWKGGRHIHSKGYVAVHVGRNRYQLEHRLVAERMLGRPLATREQVHHINGDKADNRPQNLLVLGIREHALLHEEHHFAPIQVWARGHDACVNCGLTEHRHVGRGLCRSCYSTASRREGATW